MFALRVGTYTFSYSPNSANIDTMDGLDGQNTTEKSCDHDKEASTEQEPNDHLSKYNALASSIAYLEYGEELAVLVVSELLPEEVMGSKEEACPCYVILSLDSFFINRNTYSRFVVATVM
ncbi:uncharacterized protein ARB_07509 [Trichophyton benhamiae CBS 112371]|uniref:Uncharacterized protein n=1 Tax=Arthroderma benhamiae (strain ATCC MYA-4681 / CBS 112371) TaxID=663331 RepID=D4ATE5_ARTBC|nr:uncharacterized protein ARB_07509 [Trichophyton benhamiae CBS 112371]EFE33564.1 hypothetical protein ARB_07509 [Trichophyton benhamiae CBS 112371]